ncbi:MAG: tryptophan synthase subunit alpha [Candidatus Polarisedimenticolaceae bacterium]|nr:tryptophan synthase subunit alpha [Candidatus Polarisedimenticolaceae bacterium]
MSRIAATFKSLRAQSRKALIPYITAGDPKPGITVSVMHAMVEAGADIIELGIPFSDPMADGPVIQRASERALIHHTSLRDVLKMVQEFRVDNAQTPVVLMGYLNPIEVMGYEAFAAAAAEAGVDAALTVDIPPEEAGELLSALNRHALNAIFLIAPTTVGSRIETICKVASGFVYYVSLKGVTGASHLDIAGVEQKLDEIRRTTDLPIGVGFGIKDAATAAAVSKVADAVVVGSALVSRVEALADQPDAIAPALARLLAEMRRAMDAQSQS